MLGDIGIVWLGAIVLAFVFSFAYAFDAGSQGTWRGCIVPSLLIAAAIVYTVLRVVGIAPPLEG